MQAALADNRRIAAMLAFEAALSRAEADAGILPDDAAAAIETACRTFEADIEALALATRSAANVAIPFVKALTAHCDEPGRGWVHWGATSQDVIDTASSLLFREAAALIDADLLRLGDALAAQAQAHRATVMPGRTVLQPALPITFGFKIASWLDMVTRCRAAIAAAADQALVLQFGGAVGTLSAIGPAAETVRTGLASRLGLPVPPVTSHTARDRNVRLGSELAILAGTLAKIAGDIILMMQAEIGEAAEPAAPGRGGSSTLPQKRNPVATLAIRSAALKANGLIVTLLGALPQEHERGAGGWHTEWSVLPELFDVTAGALSHMCETIEGLEVRPERMRTNLDIGFGTMMSESLMMALAPRIGRQAAHALVGAAARQAIEDQRPLLGIALDTAEITDALGKDGIESALDPSNYLGQSEANVDAAIAGWNSQRT